MLDVRFLHLYFCQCLYTLQSSLPAIAGLLVVGTPFSESACQIWSFWLVPFL